MIINHRWSLSCKNVRKFIIAMFYQHTVNVLLLAELNTTMNEYIVLWNDFVFDVRLNV